MQHMARQIEKNTDVMPLRSGYRPRKLASRQLYILQGLPGIGPQIAKRLLKRFGSVSKALMAPVERLNTGGWNRPGNREKDQGSARFLLATA